MRLRSPAALRLTLLAVLLLAPRAFAAPPPPAFLDASDTAVLWSDDAVAPDRVRVTVRCGERALPVARVDALPGAPDPDRVVLAGTFQQILGGAAWNPADDRTRMRPVGGARYALVLRLPRGRHAFKLTRGGSWARNWGAGFVPDGPNAQVDVPADGTLVRFEADFDARTLRTSLDPVDPLPAPTALPPPAPADPRTHALRVRLARPLTPAEVAGNLHLAVDGQPERPLIPRGVFDEAPYVHTGDDLGARWSKARTDFAVWSPGASSVALLCYRAARGGAPRAVPMRRTAHGVWRASLPGDRHGLFYAFRYTHRGRTVDGADIFARAASADSRRAMVLDPARATPPDWERVPVPRLRRPTDAVVYELHVRDFTVDPSSGVPPALRGKYLGVVVPGTRGPSGAPTGLDHLRRLGITHVQVLPIQNFNPDHSRGYNWGYETTLFDVPEEQYATRPDDPVAVVREAKQMIAGLHRAGIGVVMDVVYNHTVPSEGDASAFWASAPYFWFRTGLRGEVLNESGVGNAWHDERPMARRYVVASLLHWLRAYRVDGFRFDLLGMFAPESVRAIAAALRRERPDVLLYGEPWTGGGPVRFGTGAQRGTGVGIFNDRFRGVVRGDLDGDVPGFAAGGGADPAALRRAFSGSPEIADTPAESVNYVSAHDNLTLRDKLARALPAGLPDAEGRALRLAHAAVLLAPGIAFLEGGAELGRTKGGNPNSYDAGDRVNRFDWGAASRFAPTTAFVRALIALRRAHPALRLESADAVRRHLVFVSEERLPPRTVAFAVRGVPGDAWGEVLVALHGGTAPARMELPPGEWRVALDARGAGASGTVRGSLTLAPLGAVVLVRAGR